MQPIVGLRMMRNLCFVVELLFSPRLMPCLRSSFMLFSLLFLNVIWGKLKRLPVDIGHIKMKRNDSNTK
jgi:hypothetical protein